MNSLRSLLTCVLLGALATGCASLNQTMGKFTVCTALGIAAGAAAGGATTSDAGGALLGAAGGAVMSQLFCGQDESLDSDGDGVPDALDECPETAADIEVDARGCPKDSDGDGIADIWDKCPGTPRGTPVDADGCPFKDYVADTDGDGVPDNKDDCPGTPAGAMVNEDGCPPAKVMIENIQFNFDSAKITPIAKASLDARAIQALRAHPQMRVTIVGHTDSTGPASYNEGLSLRRALAVREYLVSQGVSITRLSVAGKGESQPVASNATRAGRADNRRVEFIPN